jgi:hypothetical protein
MPSRPFEGQRAVSAPVADLRAGALSSDDTMASGEAARVPWSKSSWLPVFPRYPHTNIRLGFGWRNTPYPFATFEEAGTGPSSHHTRSSPLWFIPGTVNVVGDDAWIDGFEMFLGAPELEALDEHAASSTNATANHANLRTFLFTGTETHIARSGVFSPRHPGVR